MEAAEAKIQKVLEGSKQFLVPHYQRPYSWREGDWKTLWNDLLELLDGDAKPHFLGSIVTSPARSTPEGVEKRLLIDGQQRLTTLLVLLALIRDRARESGATRHAERIQDLITNRHDDGHDHYKLLPTQSEDPAESDRETFLRIVAGTPAKSESGISHAYSFFASKLRRADAPDLEDLSRVLTSKLTLVSIILDEKDNPHRIFESLNGKGRPLSQADLIRNYFFMRLHESEHERVYVDLWRPMQRRLGEDALTDFVRHYLTRFGSVVRETDVYAGLKVRVDGDAVRPPLAHLEELARFSEHYEILLRPEKAPSPALRDRLVRLNRLEVTVAYPFLLGVYADFATGARSEADVCGVLDIIENYLVRRFVCGVPTYGLNKIFAPLYVQSQESSDFMAAVKRILGGKNCPRDDVFRERLGTARLYGGGDRREKTKLILERLESALGHKERVDASALTIEHVMPQSLTSEWQAQLGETWEEDHDQLLHTLGNLTLTSYNPELSNSPFGEKKALFATSHVELNRYFQKAERWSAAEIERRSDVLAEMALSLWPYFGPQQSSTDADADARVTGTVPSLVRFRGQDTVVQSWADVAAVTIEGILTVGEEEFARVTAELPKLVNADPTGFRRSSRPRRLSNGAYVETNLSAAAIYRLCVQAVQLAGLGADDWSVDHAALNRDQEDEGDDADEPPTQVKQLQLEFWTAVRTALEETGKFASLRAPRPQYWFDIALGRSNVWMSLTANVTEGRVSVRIVLAREIADRALEVLGMDREAIEREIGGALEWNPHPNKRLKTIKLTHPARVIDRTTWPAATAWLASTASAFRSAFAPRVADLDLKNMKLPLER